MPGSHSSRTAGNYRQQPDDSRDGKIRDKLLNRDAKTALVNGLLRLRCLVLRLGRRCRIAASAIIFVVVLVNFGRRSHELSSEGLRPASFYSSPTTNDDGLRAVLSSPTALTTNVTDEDVPLPFRIVILTQRRHWSLLRLLRSVDAADYSSAGPGGVRLEIRVDYHDSYDHDETLTLARDFDFRHGTKEVIPLNSTRGLQYAWFEAWIPTSDDERAVIVEDDMELSPLWFSWLTRAWDEYGQRADLGGISLCRQRLNASDGKIVMVQNSDPFLYRIPGSFGFSPHAMHWKKFISWVLSIDLLSVNIDVKGTVTTDWHRAIPNSWEQYWIWWCFRDDTEKLYTLYVHSRKGALIGHWAEPGVHATEPARRNDDLLNATEAVLESFPKELEHYGWDFKLEDNGR